MLGGCVRRSILMILSLAGALVLAGCDNYKSDIVAVKHAETVPGETNGNW